MEIVLRFLATLRTACHGCRNVRQSPRCFGCIRYAHAEPSGHSAQNLIPSDLFADRTRVVAALTCSSHVHAGSAVNLHQPLLSDDNEDETGALIPDQHLNTLPSKENVIYQAMKYAGVAHLYIPLGDSRYLVELDWSNSKKQKKAASKRHAAHHQSPGGRDFGPVPRRRPTGSSVRPSSDGWAFQPGTRQSTHAREHARCPSPRACTYLPCVRRACR